MWIDEYLKSQELFQYLKERIVYIEDCCDDNCNFLDHIQDQKVFCWLFGRYIDSKRHDVCMKMFGC